VDGALDRKVDLHGAGVEARPLIFP
jgi:hypothetical protein